MFVFGMFMLIGTAIQMFLNAGKKTFDIGALLMFIYVLLTLVN